MKHYCVKNTLQKAASRARGDRLCGLYEICEKQKVILTSRLLSYVEAMHESDKQDAIHFREVAKTMQAQAEKLEQLELWISGLSDAHNAVPEWIRNQAKAILAELAE